MEDLLYSPCLSSTVWYPSLLAPVSPKAKVSPSGLVASERPSTFEGRLTHPQQGGRGPRGLFTT